VGITARHIFPQSGNTKVTEKILDLIVPVLPDPGSSPEADFLYFYLDNYVPGDPESYTKAERIEAFLKACGWGPVDGTKAREDGTTAEDAAKTLCALLAAAGTFNVIELPDWLISALTSPNDPEEFPGQVMKLLQSLMPDDTTYQNLTAVADLMGMSAADALYSDPLSSLARKGYSQGYIEDACRHFSDLKMYIRPLRTLLMTVLFSTKGETFSIEGMVRNLSLLAANVGLINPSHYVQVDLAWAKARRAKGIWDHSPEPPPPPAPKPTPKTGDTAQPLLWLLMILTGLSVCTLAAVIPARRKRK